MIESPSAAGRPLRLGERGVEIRIHVEADHPGFPLDSVKVKVGREILAGGKTVRRCGIACFGNGAGTVKRTVDRAGFPSDIFHYVDFAASGPVDGSDVVAKHPESGPHSPPCGNFDARFEAAVSLAEEALSFEASRGVVAHGAATAGVRGLVHRGNDQVATLHLSILRKVCIALEFIVAPAVATGVVGPFGRVGSSAIGAVELIAPD